MDEYILIGAEAGEKHAFALHTAHEAIAKLTPAEKQTIKASSVDSLNSGDIIGYEVSGNTARIALVGTLMPTSDPFLSYFGVAHTGYDAVCAGVAAAEADPQVTEIEYMIDTPGGYFSGLDIAAETIASASKPSKGFISGQCCSAGYYLGSQIDQLIAMSKGSQVGSIGVVVSLNDYSKMYERIGIKTINIVNDQSPDKRPDLSTEEGQAKLRERLNEMYALFEERVVQGREANSKFSLTGMRELKGATVMATKATEIGMIDSVRVLTKKKNAVVEPSSKENRMTLATAMANDPELKTEVEALVAKATEDGTAAGKAKATADEQERIIGLLNISKVALSEPLNVALKDGSTKERLAVALIESGNIPTAQVPAASVAPAKANTNILPSVVPQGSQVPGADAVAAEDKKKFDALMAEVFPTKKAQ